MGKLTGESSVEIDAPIATVWAELENVLGAAEWQGGMKSMAAVETDADGRATVVDVVADGKVRDLKSRQRFTYAGPNKLSWSQEKGDMSAIDGSWTLESLDENRTKATYALVADPGRKLGLVIRGPVEMALRAMLVNPRAGELKKRIEG
ncbi:MAG: SRPBCC family protein [Solirubrobacteraceae bacterium]|nr:SRPBCC family protein [Solirubrobacteraceae bacterium]